MKNSPTSNESAENLTESQTKLEALRRDVDELVKTNQEIANNIKSSLLDSEAAMSAETTGRQDVSLWHSGIDAQQIIDNCHSRRMQMFGLILTQQREALSLDKLSEIYLSDNVLDQISVGSVINHGAGGLAYSRIGEYMVFLLPQVIEPMHWDEIDSELDQIFINPTEKMTWLFDFSAIEFQPPMEMIKGLISYRDSLAQKGITVKVAWLRDELFAPEVYQELKPLLNLELIGGNWFSRNVKSE